jgi:nickel-dependent lactate racemase
VTVFPPTTPPPMTDSAISNALERPAGQPALRDLARGAKRPAIIVDDVNRGTPVGSILPHVIRQFSEAGISPDQITIVMATGAHALPQAASVRNKIGEIAAKCRVRLHDSRKDLVRLGTTSFGTPVLLNKEVAASDFVVGVGGLYPNSTAGYGGGSKLVLGVLGFRSILCLHYLHGGAGRGQNREKDSFRLDLNEIADMARMRSLVSVHVNAQCKIVRLRCGDYRAYYDEERAFAQRVYTVSSPGDADVVISNAYPNDLSLTFALMKGAAPLHVCKPGSSRILVARCSEGVGGHSLFPVVHVERSHALKMYLRFAAARPGPFLKKALRVASKRFRRKATGSTKTPGGWKNSIHLYAEPGGGRSLPSDVAGVNMTSSWAEIVAAVQREQANAGPTLKVAVYPCSPLLVFK